MASKFPDFDDLPPVPGMPQGCAWGLFDKDGQKDVFGTLNFITPEIVKEAAKEVQDGSHVSLNWEIGAIETPGFTRKGLVHNVKHFRDNEALKDCHGYDDEVEFNTQCSSQWDSLMHFHHQPSNSGYNGVRSTNEELAQAFGKWDRGMRLPTLNHWHKRGGLVTRGVFIDFKRWADAQGRKFNPFDADCISIEDIEAVAKSQGVEFHYGDVLVIRSGYTDALAEMDGEQQTQAMSTHRVCGVETTERICEWIWNHRFAAVAGDMIAFEHIPPKNPQGVEGGIKDLVLHQYLLSLFGMSIGELWDLRALSAHCAKIGRYSFMLTSIPLNVPGSIGSPPNVIAIF